MKWKCPSCDGQELSVTVIVSARLIQHADGEFETEVEGDHEWDGDSFMWCHDCNDCYRSRSFEVEREPSDDVQMCEGGDLCTEEGLPLPAVRMMPQSEDGGVTHRMVPCCANHANGWWDGSDWDGRHLEYALPKETPQ